ncbi:MAG: SPASM domain-containing protein [Patescibacteria group bacterium]
MNVFPNVAATLPPKGQIPHRYRLMVNKWSFPEDRIGETVTAHGETIKKMLTLDINIPETGFAVLVNAQAPGSDAAKRTFVKSYPCPHACPGCFNNADLFNPIMSLEEVFSVIDQACELGLESMKFLGPGELLANPRMFYILDELARRNIVAGIFTKAAMMGNDMLSQHYHGIGSEELTRRLATYPNITFLVGGRSFDPALENRFIPQNRREFSERFDYHAARGLAIERLCAHGMNADLMHQRLEIACAPVTSENIGGCLELYQWGTERNIPVVMPPTMVSGKGHRLEKAAAEVQFEDDYIELAVAVYTWAIQRGVMTVEQLLHEGAAPYIGIAPCNQLTHGLYIHYDGQVWRCPGNDTPDFVVHHNVREAPLRQIWVNSRNYGIQAFNNGCVKDGISLPMRFYSEVPERVVAMLKI